ncbi:MAG: ComEC family competence protein [Oscillospiraceae bacterium]|nr:ComEC family competence protein [Oscillospiraceae bacterium]
MVFAGTAWAAGLASAALAGSEFAVFAAALLVAFLFNTLFRFNLKSIIFMLTCFSLAFAYYNIYDMTVYRQITDFSGCKVSYSGTVTDFQDYSNDNSVYYLNGKINGRYKAKLMVYTDSVMCEPGDTMSFEAEVRTPENTYLFDSRDYYKSKGIYLQTDSAENVTVENCGFSVRKSLFRFREKVCRLIDSSVSTDEGGMIKGMLFGDKSGIDDDFVAMLNRTGIGHITAVSGLHLVLFCTLISFILRRFKIGRIAEFAILEAFMLLFALCCGMTPSVMRSLAMMTIVNLAPLFFRYSDSFNSIGTAIILLTVSNPFIILNPSFLLSVSGSLGAGVFAPYMTSGMRADSTFRRFIKNAAYFLCVSAAVTPVMFICFGELSLVSPLSNLIITPICMAALLISMLGALLIFINPAVMFKISGALCRIVLNISEIIGKNKFTHIKLSGEYVTVITAVLVVFCISSYLIFKNRKYSAFSVVISFALIFSSGAFYNIAMGRIVKTALLGENEVGVIVVSKGNTADIIDLTGNRKNCRYVSKYLDSLGIYEINNILLVKLPYSSMSSYNSELTLFSVNNVVIPADTYIRRGSLICSCVPKYSDFSYWSADYGRYKVSVNGYNVDVNYGNYNFECTDGGDGVRKYKSNIVLYMTSSGKSDFRRLENG